jgi:hypothetical protein
MHGCEFGEAAPSRLFIEQRRELSACRGETLISEAVGVEEPRFAEHLVEAHRAFERGDVGDEAARQPRALHAFQDQLLAGRRQTADLKGRIDHRPEQRTRDEREPQQHQSAKRF